MKILLALILTFSTSTLCQMKPPGASLIEQKDKILCAITSFNNIYNASRIAKETWAKECDILIFAGQFEDKDLPIHVMVPWKATALQKLQNLYQHIHENYKDKATWFLTAQPDAFFMLKNVRAMLSQFDANSALNIGQKFNKYNKKFINNEGGSIMSKKALELFATTCSQNFELFNDASEWMAKKMMKECLEQNGLENVDLCIYEDENLTQLMNGKNLHQTKSSNCTQAFISLSTKYLSSAKILQQLYELVMNIHPIKSKQMKLIHRSKSSQE